MPARKPEAECSYNTLYAREYRKKLTKERKDAILLVDRICRTKIKYAVLERYTGGKPRCVCCGEERVFALTIDHITPPHRTEQKQSIYRRLTKLNFPPGFQVLCRACNAVKMTRETCDCKILNQIQADIEKEKTFERQMVSV